MRMLPVDADAVLVRTDFTDQPAWERLVDSLRVLGDSLDAMDGLEVIDNPAWQGLSVTQLMALMPPDADYLYLAVADRFTDGTLLVVGTWEEERGMRFRTMAEELPTIDANLNVGNLSIAEYLEGVGDDGIYPARTASTTGSRPFSVADDWPVVTELLPDRILRHGSMPSPSGDFVLVHQEDGDVVIYRVADGVPVWRTGTASREWTVGMPNRLVLLDRGDLVLFEPTGVPVWSSGTAGQPARRALVTDDGRLVLVDAGGMEIWSSEHPGPASAR